MPNRNLQQLADALDARPPDDADRVGRLLVLGGWLDPWALTRDDDED